MLSSPEVNHASRAHQSEGSRSPAFQLCCKRPKYPALTPLQVLHLDLGARAGCTEVCKLSLRVRPGPQMMSFRRELPSRDARLTAGRPANEQIRRTGSARGGDPWTITLVVMWARPIVPASCKRQKCKLGLVTSAGWAWGAKFCFHSQSNLNWPARARSDHSWHVIGGDSICLLWLAEPLMPPKPSKTET